MGEKLNSSAAAVDKPAGEEQVTGERRVDSRSSSPDRFRKLRPGGVAVGVALVGALGLSILLSVRLQQLSADVDRLSVQLSALETDAQTDRDEIAALLASAKKLVGGAASDVAKAQREASAVDRRVDDLVSALYGWGGIPSGFAGSGSSDIKRLTDKTDELVNALTGASARLASVDTRLNALVGCINRNTDQLQIAWPRQSLLAGPGSTAPLRVGSYDRYLC